MSASIVLRLLVALECELTSLRASVSSPNASVASSFAACPEA